jgi:lipopolysaccharide assembly protein A
MRILIWLLRAAVFILLLGFAIQNDGVVTVRAYLDSAWQVPLVVVMLGMLLAGFLLGATALLGTLFMQRREISRLSKQVAAAVSPSSTRTRLPPDDAADSF